MSFKIDRFVGEKNAIVLRVCGRMNIECVNTIKELSEKENVRITFDLSEVTIANRDAAIFLAVSELIGNVLWNCPPFLREWVTKEKLRMTP